VVDGPGDEQGGDRFGPYCEDGEKRISKLELESAENIGVEEKQHAVGRAVAMLIMAPRG